MTSNRGGRSIEMILRAEHDDGNEDEEILTRDIGRTTSSAKEREGAHGERSARSRKFPN